MVMTFALTQSYKAGLDPDDQVVEGFGGGHQVKWSRQRPSLIEIRQPEFSTSKLPLHISVFLQKHEDINQIFSEVSASI